MKIENNLNLSDIQAITVKILTTYKVIVTSAVILLVGVLVLQRINRLTDPQLDQAHLTTELSTLKKVNFNDEAIKKIEALTSTGINITSDFTDRSNPFEDN